MNYQEIFYQIYPFGFCGAPKENDGNLAHRITKVLDFIPHYEKLGITAIWFSPVFESDRHGYDTRDYRTIDCRLGDNEDFKKVCHALHQSQIKVILDGVFNHVGRGFFAFQDVLANRENSRYKDWFYLNFADTWNDDGFGYADWEGHHELVKLNLDNPEVKQYLLESVDQWIRDYEIDGLRLDVAYMVNRNFLRELKEHVKAINPNFFLLGEMIGGDYNVLLRDCGLDSVTNYECRKGIYSSLNSHNLFEIGYSYNRQFGNDPWTLYHGQHLLSFVDNHDVDRIASVLEDERDIPLAYALVYAMPGIPCIYYGSEWKAVGKRTPWNDDDLRPCFDQPEWNEVTDYISALSKLHQSYPVLSNGNYQQVYLQNEQLVFSRQDETGEMLFAINIANHPVSIPGDYGKAYDVLQETEMDLHAGICLEAKSAAFYWLGER